MKPQATRLTSRQLAYLAHWKNSGHKIGRNEVIPEDTRIAPGGDAPELVELLVTGAMLVVVFVLVYFA